MIAFKRLGLYSELFSFFIRLDLSNSLNQFLKKTRLAVDMDKNLDKNLLF